jgi:hypothetical protein
MLCQGQGGSLAVVHSTGCARRVSRLNSADAQGTQPSPLPSTISIPLPRASLHCHLPPLLACPSLPTSSIYPQRTAPSRPSGHPSVTRLAPCRPASTRSMAPAAAAGPLPHASGHAQPLCLLRLRAAAPRSTRLRSPTAMHSTRGRGPARRTRPRRAGMSGTTLPRRCTQRHRPLPCLHLNM